MIVTVIGSPTISSPSMTVIMMVSSASLIPSLIVWICVVASFSSFPMVTSAIAV